MEKIWCNRILAGTRTFDDVPESRKFAVENEFKRRLNEGIISQEQYNNALGIVEPEPETETEGE